MNTLRYSLMAWFVAGVLTVSAQDNTGAAQFPDLTPDVRGVGMGNTGVASSANAFSVWRNAAKSVFSDKKAEIGYSFTPWMRELTKGNDLHSVGGYYNINDKQGITAGFRWFKHAEIDLLGDDATFTPKDWSVEIGYARKLVKGLSLGATARFVRSDLSGVEKDAVANAVAFDLGVYYRHTLAGSEKSVWALGLQAANFGTKIDYGYGKYDQPAKVSIGGMIDHVFSDKHRLQGTLDAGYRVLPNTCWEWAVGAEYAACDKVFVRGGYHWGEENNRMQRYGTVGCGVNLWHVRADFAYLLPETNSFLKNTWQVAVAIDLDWFLR